MNKEQKQENKYLTTVLNYVTKPFTDKELIKCQKVFDEFCTKINQSKLGLLRKGEVMLRSIFISI